MRFQWSKAVWPLLALLVPCLVFGAPYENDEWLPGHLIVNFKASVGARTPVTLDDGTVSMGISSVDELLATYQVYEAKRLVPDGILSRLDYPPDFGRLYVLYFPEAMDVLSMIPDFEANAYVKWAEPNLMQKILRTPNDPLWGHQWDKVIMGCDIAWDIGTGDSTIIVCAIDTGTDWNHEDLTPNLWVNPGEDLNGDGVPWIWDDIPGDPEEIDWIDNDGNGYVDDFIGWDFIDNQGNCAAGEDCDDPDNDPFGLEPHGTHCLGLMAARGNNQVGVAGAGWRFRAMAIRAGIAASDGNGYIVASTPAIIYAAAMGAKIITMSYGSTGASQAEREAIQAAWDNGCLFFGAAGNDGSEQMQYPACHPHVISVASTNESDRLSSWSNRGTWVDICAPGDHPIWSTVIDGYGGSGWGGTSMSAPNAGGVAALVWTMMPELTNAEMETLIYDNCVNIDALNPGLEGKLGHGRISASNMVGTRFPHLSVIDITLTGDDDGDGRLERNETADLIFNIENAENWATALGIRGLVQTDDPHLTVSEDSIYFGDLLPGAETDNWDFPVEISADNTIEQPYVADLTLGLTTETGYEVSIDFQIPVERPPLLFVDDDGGLYYDAQFSGDFEELGVPFDSWSTVADGPLDALTISYYQEIFWCCGNEETATLTADDQAALATFLDGGGKLALGGRLIDRDLRDDPFYANYLHCSTGSLDSSGRVLSGVLDDPISGETNLLLVGSCANNGTAEQSRIVPLEGASVIYTYDADGRPAAVRYGDTTTYQVVYCAFALEAACGASATTHHRVVVQRILEWFRGHPLSAVPPVAPSVPEQYALLGNFPNPFNPTTTVCYEVRASGHVTLTVHDVLGRLTATLVDGPASVGTHRVRFNGSSLPSGIYFVHMTAPGYSGTNKMVLLK